MTGLWPIAVTAAPDRSLRPSYGPGDEVVLDACQRLIARVSETD